MSPLVSRLRRVTVGLSQYLAILLSPRGVSPRRDENDLRLFSKESRMKPLAFFLRKNAVGFTAKG